jgi:hypothetical protein
MPESRYRAVKAYKNNEFLNSPDARALRILAEYLEPNSRFEELEVRDTIVFFGSARTLPRDVAETALALARAEGGDRRSQDSSPRSHERSRANAR